jgi:hypothetical protein
MRKIAEAVALLLVMFIAAATAWAVWTRSPCRTGFRGIVWCDLRRTRTEGSKRGER